jgi:hypothetical protein
MALRRDFADSMVPRVSLDDISVVIHCDSSGQVYLMRKVPFSVLMGVYGAGVASYCSQLLWTPCCGSSSVFTDARQLL